MSKLLAIQNLDVNYGDSPALRGVSLSVETGEIVGVVGESGSGKSTTIYAALGILEKGGRVVDGSILYDGTELLTLPKERLRRLRGKEISLIAQNPVESFHPIRKIRSQLHELVKSHGGMTVKDAELRMLSIMDKINLKDGERILDSYAFEMSGGMCQRVSIALSMVLQPRLLMADEPTSALDVVVQKQVVNELMKIREEYQTAILMISHNMGVISYMADRVVVMYAGMVLEYGSNKAVICRAKHPYTQNLIAAIPKMDAPMPEEIHAPVCDRNFPGCPYYGGCSRRSIGCSQSMPELKETEEGHFVRCFYV